MGNRGLAIMAGIVGGVEKTVSNLQNIQIMKYKLKQDQETFGLDKKIKEAQLKRYELDPNFDPEIHLQQKTLLDKQYKQSNALADLNLAIIDAAEKGEKKKVEELHTQYDTIMQALNWNLGTTNKTPNINIDEQIKRKVATSGVESLTPEEKPLWERMNKANPVDTTQSKQTEEGIRTKIAQGEILAPEEVNYYNKFMWRTGNEMKPPKKDKFGYYVGQKMKGHNYIGNNQWQAE